MIAQPMAQGNESLTNPPVILRSVLRHSPINAGAPKNARRESH